MLNFILGIGSSIIASFIIYFFRYNLGFIVNLIFFKLYPNVTGEYNFYSYNTALISKNEARKKCNDKNNLVSASDVRPSQEKLLKWLESKSKNSAYFVMNLKQVANQISGELYAIDKNKIIHLEKIKGKITPTRILVLNYESTDLEHHNYGTYLLNLTSDSKIMKGEGSGLCSGCGEATSKCVVLKKK